MSQHLLVVDDDHAILKVLGDRLRSYGYEVSCVSDGAAALQKMAEREPDCVLLDLEMPGIKGFEVLTTLRRDWPALPVVVVTASASKHIAKKALAAGATGYVLKPFEPEVLRKEIARALSSGHGSEEQEGLGATHNGAQNTRRG